MDRLGDFRTFTAIVDANSLSGAARTLGVTRASISQRLRRLEDRLGVRLLNRSTRAIGLTDVGHAFYERARDVLASAEQAEACIHELGAEPRGTLRINAPMSYGRRFVSPVVAELVVEHPSLAIELTLVDRQVDVVEEGFDVVIRIAAMRDSSLIARRLAPCPVHLVASPAYLKRNGTPKTPGDLSHHNCLRYAHLTSGDAWRLSDGERTRTVRVFGSLVANNGDVVLEAAVQGAGIAFLPEFIAGDALADGRLRRVMRRWRGRDLVVHALYPHSRPPAKVRAFVDRLSARV